MTLTQLYIADGEVSAEDYSKVCGGLVHGEVKSILQLDSLSSYDAAKVDEAILVVTDTQKLVANYEQLGVVIDKVLVPGGKLLVKSTEPWNNDDQMMLARKIKYSGFIGVQVTNELISGLTQKEVHTLSFSCHSGSTNDLWNSDFNTTYKFQFQVGGSDSITLKDDEFLRRKIIAPASASGDDLIDEDDLLTEEDKVKPDPASLKG